MAQGQKLLTGLEDLTKEDTDGYQGIFFTDASKYELMMVAKEWFPKSHRDNVGTYMQETIEIGTTLRILDNKPKFEELTVLISQGFVTRVDCFGAGELLHHIDDVVKSLLESGKRVVLFVPFHKTKPQPIHGGTESS